VSAAAGELAERVTHHLAAVPGSVHMAVFDAGHAWTLDPTGEARARLKSSPAPTQTPAGAPPGRDIAGDPATRWATLARTVDPRLPAGEDWPLLADALNRAHAAGYDVATELPQLAAQTPLPEHRPAAEMYWRLVDDCPAAAPPHVRRQAPEPTYAPEHIRHPHEPPPSHRHQRDRSPGPDR